MKEKAIIVRILISIFGIFLTASIVPALLSASNDLAVLMGVVIIVGIIVLGYLNYDKIIDWYKNI